MNLQRLCVGVASTVWVLCTRMSNAHLLGATLGYYGLSVFGNSQKCLEYIFRPANLGVNSRYPRFQAIYVANVVWPMLFPSQYLLNLTAFLLPHVTLVKRFVHPCLPLYKSPLPPATLSFGRQVASVTVQSRWGSHIRI